MAGPNVLIWLVQCGLEIRWCNLNQEKLKMVIDQYCTGAQYKDRMILVWSKLANYESGSKKM